MRTPFLCAGLLLFAALANAQIIPSTGLVAYYQFNGNTLDSSGNGNNLTLSGPSQYVTNQDGTPDGALEFLGSDVTYNYFQAQGTLGTSLDGSSISVSMWVNQQTIPQPAGWTFRIGDASASGQAITVALNYPDDLRWSFFNDDLDANVTPTPSLNTWYNVTGTYNATTQVSGL
jgi:hypothetical protein